jgi:hypothetical protein
MSFEEIAEELPKLTTEEKERLRQFLNTELSWTEEEEQAIDEGIRSREEAASAPWEVLDRQLRESLPSPSAHPVSEGRTTPPASRIHSFLLATDNRH